MSTTFMLGRLSLFKEDYNRLLTKYAEAENTIDRLRLEAKVSLIRFILFFCLSVVHNDVLHLFKAFI